MTQEISKLNQELKYTASDLPQLIVLDLQDIKIADEQYSKLRKKYQTFLTISVVSIFAAFLFLFFPPLSIAVLIIAIASSIYFNRHYQKYARLKIEPYRYLIANKLTKLLQRDMPEANNLKIDLDFRKSMIPSKLISEEKHPTRSGWKLKKYQDPWLSLQGEFCDRTNFSLNIIEHHRNAAGYKRGSSGKRKYKSKNKFKGLEISLQLRYPAKKYGAIQVLQEDALNAIKLPPYAQIKNFKLNSKYIVLTVKLPNHFAPQANTSPRILAEQKTDTTYATIAAMFLSLYQILNLARTLSKVSR